MSSNQILRWVVAGLMSVSAIGLPACTQNNAEPQQLTGSEAEHERHAGGIPSHSAD